MAHMYRTKEEEIDYIKNGMQQPLSKWDMWDVISLRWFDLWKKHIGFSSPIMEVNNVNFVKKTILLSN